MTTLPNFIREEMEEIVSEWVAFAATLTPAAGEMDFLALRDHAKPMLQAIARDIESSQTDEAQESKSKGLDPDSHFETAAMIHGNLRQTAGFDLRQLVAEFRALRATVLRLWVERHADEPRAYEMTRFNEAVDQALAESVDSYSDELERSRDTFLAILGHDLRSPLSAIAGALNILSQPVNNDMRAKAQGAATRSVAAMDEMIHDLLDYTRSRLGKGIPINPAQGDLEAVCKAAIHEVSLGYPETEFEFDASGTLDGHFDGARMRQVVSNLLNNAVQHGKPGKPVRVGLEGNGSGLALEVTNEGSFIPADQLETIFEPMVQLEPGAKTPPSNMGLGLFIARQIIEAHGGTIVATSSRAIGTRFTAKLPRVARAAAQSA